jgi:glycosyltransferase involved in cell wall biosynthesis
MQFHILSFEGPDAYSSAGGIASRVTGLSQALADSGFETHLWFVGDPNSAGQETRGKLHLHRWCQWISAYHPAGVYDGEEGKRADFVRSLPPFLFREALLPHLRTEGNEACILAEEWQTADAVLHLDWLLRCTGLRQRVKLLWNANNTFGFDRVDWKRLAKAAVVTAVSRYMRYRMWSLGLDPLVIPNGISEEALQLPEKEAVAAFHRLFRNRTVLGKVARWDPDKRWLLAVQTIAELKRQGKRPLLIARGGVEAYQNEVRATASSAGLRVQDRKNNGGGVQGLLEGLRNLEDVDMVSLGSPLDSSARRTLYKGCDAILANSGHEPFGLVGLETMAVAGLACTGGTGEDYVVPGWNALVLQTADPREFLGLFLPLQSHPPELRTIRRHGRLTANQHTWKAIIKRSLWPRLATEQNGTQKPYWTAVDNLFTQRAHKKTLPSPIPSETLSPAAFSASEPVLR